MLVSVVANLLVILVMAYRRRKFKSTHIFIVALAVSDTLFSLAIHPMLIATAFGANSHELFGVYGKLRILYILIIKQSFFFSMWVGSDVRVTHHEF